MTEADAIASLQGIKHQLLAIFKTLGGPRVYLEDGAGPAAVIMSASDADKAWWAMLTAPVTTIRGRVNVTHGDALWPSPEGQSSRSVIPSGDEGTPHAQDRSHGAFPCPSNWHNWDISPRTWDRA